MFFWGRAWQSDSLWGDAVAKFWKGPMPFCLPIPREAFRSCSHARAVFFRTPRARVKRYSIFVETSTLKVRTNVQTCSVLVTLVLSPITAHNIAEVFYWCVKLYIQYICSDEVRVDFHVTQLIRLLFRVRVSVDSSRKVAPRCVQSKKRFRITLKYVHKEVLN